jgi:hypothetical protein
MKTYWQNAAWFVAIGVLLYGALYAGAERLVYLYGDSNPIFKIRTAPRKTYDYVILGASHAMPLDFGTMNGYLEQRTGTSVLNLATPGNGILYNRYVLDCFLERKQARNVLYVLDSFAFYSRQWNEDRFNDVKLWRATPLDRSAVSHLAAMTWNEGVRFSVLADYLSGFSKINSEVRFQVDQWEGEQQFDRKYRFSPTRDKQRIQYLYPQQAIDEAAFNRYVQQLADLIDSLKGRGIGFIAVKTPVPEQIYRLIPHEKEFDETMKALFVEKAVPFYDFSLTGNDQALFFDTDHLNREGVKAFMDNQLSAVLMRHAPAAATTTRPVPQG